MQNAYSRPEAKSESNTSQLGEKLSFVSVLQELVNALRNLARSEAKLIRNDVKATLMETGRHTLLFVVVGMVAFLGLLPFLAFLIILTGQLLGENYWLSSLLISLFFTGIGIALGAILAKRLSKQSEIDVQVQRPI